MRPTTLGRVTVQPPDPPGIRIADSDRERAAMRLNQALAEGRITVSELEERLSVVYAARYEADLRAPLADLPGAEHLGGPGARVALPDTPRVELRSGMSTLKRTGDWEVPARLRLHTTMGTIVLDFADARLPQPVIDIEVEVGAGTVKLLLPDAATANIDDIATSMGTVKSSVPSRPQHGQPHFVVHGRTSMGTVVVRRRFRFAGHYF